jgi:putative protein-disulfide isomerase
MEKYPGFLFDIQAGGMVTGNRVAPLSQKSDYLLRKVQAIENTTGTVFGEAYKAVVKEGKMISDSEPPSIAFNVFKSFRPDLRFRFAHSIQDLHFRQGKDPNQMKSYFDICEEFGVNKFGFMDRFQDPAYKQLTRDVFDQTEARGIRNFPSLVAEHEGRQYMIQQGYDAIETVEQSFLRVMKEAGIHPAR